MSKKQGLWDSIRIAWAYFTRKEKVLVIFSFLASLGFSVYGIAVDISKEVYDFNFWTSITMSVFGFIGTWTLAIQWQGTFVMNGIQNIAGIATAANHKVYGDMFTSFYYLITEFIGHFSWKKRRDKDGYLHVDKTFNWETVLNAIFFWTIGLGLVSYWMGGKQIVLDALTNGFAFTAQQRQVTGHKDGYYLWLVVDIMSFILFMRAGNSIVAFSYLGMLMQGIIGIMIWNKGKGSAK